MERRCQFPTLISSLIGQLVNSTTGMVSTQQCIIHTSLLVYDAYVDVIRNLDPLQTALVFSCGMGAVRTTFAMVAATIVRRKQLIARGLPDPYASKNGPVLSTRPSNSGSSTVSSFVLVDSL